MPEEEFCLEVSVVEIIYKLSWWLIDQTHLFFKIFKTWFSKKYWYLLFLVQNDIAKFLFKEAFPCKYLVKILNPSLKNSSIVP